MKLKNRCRRSFGEIRAEVGKKREQLFVDVWKRVRNSPNKPPWFSSVRKATHVENHYDHVDAYLIRIDGYEIPVQIKGTLRAVIEHDEKWDAVANNVIIVIVRENDSDEVVIWETQKAIDTLKSKQDEQVFKEQEKLGAPNRPLPLEKRLARILANNEL